MTTMKKIATITTLALCLSTSLVATELSKPLINYTATKQAKGDVKAVYDEIKGAYGIVPEPIKGLSLNPKVLRNTWEMYKTLGSNKNFSPKMTTMMRMLIAEKHQCKFCTGFNKSMLFNIYKLSEKEVAMIEINPSNANLDKKQKAMLLFMIKSTQHPHKVDKSDIEDLKNLGWSEKDIMEGVKQASEMVATAIFIDTFKIE